MSKFHTLIIAEAGVNHNGDVSLALELVDAAVEAKADIVKFQTFKADKLTTRHVKKAAYQIKQVVNDESQQEMLKALELTEEDHETLSAYCARKGIRFLSTGFDEDSLSMLMRIGSEFIKIPSGDITNLPLLEYAASFSKTILLSSGMANLGDIEAALNVLYSAGQNREQVIVLHCNTEYPTPLPDVNLAAMESIAKAFRVSVGYSDHTQGITVPIAAVALGARVIEKHLTLSRQLPGPDHMASLEPKEFADMVAAIRDVESAMGNGVKTPTTSEEPNIPIVRKSLVANQVIRKGEVFNEDNVTVKRPGTGISPMRWREVIGKVSLREYQPDELIEI